MKNIHFNKEDKSIKTPQQDTEKKGRTSPAPPPQRPQPVNPSPAKPKGK